ncbi:MAG: protein FxsA [Actinomycetota bacterium]|jgi:UPF0716 protein FxsA|nr:protein FxsA [Actinomycetota bacterium]
MFAGLGLLLIFVPIVELYVLIQVGQVIGVLPTIALLIGVSIAGTMLLKREGMATWRRVQEALARGEMPTTEVIDGFLILLGGALLLTPGFVTDVFGLLFLFPPTRAGARAFFRKALGLAVIKRFPGASTAASTGRKVYQARVSNTRRVDSAGSTPEPLPSAPLPPPGEDGSPGTR